MSEEEFDQWHDELLRGEWVDGRVEFMAPASNQHVQIVVFQIKLLDTFAEQRRLGKAFGSELAVKLPKQRRRRVPDVAFLSASRMELLRPTYVDGAPDLIMEVVSPDSVGRDWRTKYQEYEQAGVREYWIVDPAQEGWRGTSCLTAERIANSRKSTAESHLRSYPAST
jgi:Uma2 family endonuclease